MTAATLCTTVFGYKISKILLMESNHSCMKRVPTATETQKCGQVTSKMNLNPQKITQNKTKSVLSTVFSHVALFGTTDNAL